MDEQQQGPCDAGSNEACTGGMAEGPNAAGSERGAEAVGFADLIHSLPGVDLCDRDEADRGSRLATADGYEPAAVG